MLMGEGVKKFVVNIKGENPIKIRMATVEDAEEILRIYEPYVLSSSATFEYDVPSIEEFKNRIKNTLLKFPYLVAEMNGYIIGYAYASLFKERIAYQYSCEVSIYMMRGMQNKGVGKRLYDALESILKRQGIQNLNACITYPNERSIAFHTSRGYKMVAHFHKCGYKFNTWYDMVWMEKLIGVHEEVPNNFKTINEIEYKDLIGE